MSALDDLLAVQAIDTTLDQLRHRRVHLPERDELKDVEAKRKALAVEHAEAVAVRDEVAGRQANFEKDIAASEARIVEIDKRMYSGEVTASRDLEAMTKEISSIRSRGPTLEDHAPEATEGRWPLAAARAAREGRADRY